MGHYTGAGDDLDVEDLYTKYKVKKSHCFHLKKEQQLKPKRI